MTKCNNSKKSLKALVESSSASTSPNKKSQKTLKPPTPNKFNQIDTESCLHAKISASGYGMVIGTKGPITGPRVFTCPTKQKTTPTTSPLTQTMASTAW